MFISYIRNKTNEEVLTSKDRRRLHSETFGYIDKDGGEHFPLNDAEHVANASARFHFAPKEYQKTLAENIMKKALQFGVEIKNKKILSLLKDN